MYCFYKRRGMTRINIANRSSNRKVEWNKKLRETATKINNKATMAKKTNDIGRELHEH